MSWFMVKQAKRYGVASCPPEEMVWDAAAHMAEEGIIHVRTNCFTRQASGCVHL